MHLTFPKLRTDFLFQNNNIFLKGKKNQNDFLHILVLDSQMLPRPEATIQDIFAVFFKFSKSFGPVGILLRYSKQRVPYRLVFEQEN